MRVFLALVLICFATLGGAAQAGTAGGKIVHVGTTSNNVLLFRIAGGVDTNRPACAVTLRYAVDKDSVHAPVILTAFATGKELGTVAGTGNCTFMSNSEDLQFIEVCPLNGCS
ncbi:hypothetical protein SAMN02745824_3365 [Parasphingorhabdus marina DSM 22363]|uniref:Uncharacterized protein n=1 Tax=Parasphingorhabdus marina DSM 22363 TaxID=1123272 RepID=A0A1N6HMT7_9SPHN|nr:hypothetical protein [Parasphingorhabdus marina]SIO21046.1 hypothetical protein SAMN02745824_3365 [Parasphingorhabdus marina DSM 22363]